MPVTIPLTDHQVVSIINRYAIFGSARKVSKELNISKPTVLRYLKKEGIETSRNIYKRKIISPVQAAWLAGFFDGEGHVAIIKSKQDGVNYYKLRVIVVNANKESIATIKGLMGGGCVMLIEKSKQNPKWSDIWKIQLSGLAAAAFINEIAPYTVTKKNHIKLVLEFINNRKILTKDMQDSIRQQLRRLSRNGFNIKSI